MYKKVLTSFGLRRHTHKQTELPIHSIPKKMETGDPNSWLYNKWQMDTLSMTLLSQSQNSYRITTSICSGQQPGRCPQPPHRVQPDLPGCRAHTNHAPFRFCPPRCCLRSLAAHGCELLRNMRVPEASHMFTPKQRERDFFREQKGDTTVSWIMRWWEQRSWRLDSRWCHKQQIKGKWQQHLYYQGCPIHCRNEQTFKNQCFIVLDN